MEKQMETSHKLARSIDETARVSGIGRSKLYEAIAAGELTARKFGRKTLILDEDLNAFLRGLPLIAGARVTERDQAA